MTSPQPARAEGAARGWYHHGQSLEGSQMDDHSKHPWKEAIRRSFNDAFSDAAALFPKLQLTGPQWGFASKSEKESAERYQRNTPGTLTVRALIQVKGVDATVELWHIANTHSPREARQDTVWLDMPFKPAITLVTTRQFNSAILDCQRNVTLTLSPRRPDQSKPSELRLTGVKTSLDIDFIDGRSLGWALYDLQISHELIKQATHKSIINHWVTGLCVHGEESDFPEPEDIDPAASDES